MSKASVVAALAFLLAAAPPVHAATIDVTTTGFVVPGAGCPPPPAPPLDCLLLATGTGVDLSGAYGPWTFSSPFTVFSADPLSPTTFRNGGTFHYDDPTPANNDFFGTFSGAFDFATFTAVHTYAITGGSGVFAGASGFGTGIVQVDPLNFTFVERVRFSIPLPSTLALVAAGLVLLVHAARVRR